MNPCISWWRSFFPRYWLSSNISRFTASESKSEVSEVEARVSRGNRSRNLDITVGQFLAVLLGLLVLAAGGCRGDQPVALTTAPSGAAAVPADHQQSAAVRRFEHSLARVQPLLQRYGYGAAFAAVMAEGMGIPTPGQTLLMAGALEAAQGRMSIALLLILVTTAATLGNSVGYAIGRWGGRVALDKLKVNPQRQQHLDDLFKRRGGSGNSARPISRRLETVEWHRRRGFTDAVVDLHCVQRRRRVPVDMQSGVWERTTWAGTFTS